MSSLRAPAARDSAGVDAALLILRLVLGLLILLHGVSKLPPPPEFLVGALAQARACRACWPTASTSARSSGRS